MGCLEEVLHLTSARSPIGAELRQEGAGLKCAEELPEGSCVKRTSWAMKRAASSFGFSQSLLHLTSDYEMKSLATEGYCTPACSISQLYLGGLEEVRSELLSFKLECVDRMEQLEGHCAKISKYQHEQETKGAIDAKLPLEELILDGLESRVAHLESQFEQTNNLEDDRVRVLAALEDREETIAALGHVTSAAQKADEFVTEMALIEFTLSKEVLGCLDRMRLKGVAPDALTFICTLKACSEDIDTEAQAVFDMLLSVRDEVSWSTLIKGYLEQENTKTVYLLYKQMQEQGLLPTTSTFRSLLSVYGSLIAFESVKRVDAQIRKHDGLKSLAASLVSFVINTYLKCKSTVEAQVLSDTVAGRGLARRNALITGHVWQGKTDQGFLTFEQMEDEKVQPDEIAFVSLLNACCHGGFVEMGHSYYTKMKNVYRITPSVIHLTCMMDLLGLSGQLNEAARM
ncbi:hypothetical protein L7F22_044983 [Adiantum nelumboides]|nr:hypothetical protein [Adiantum nelumboides]